MKNFAIAILLIAATSNVQAEGFSNCVDKKPDKARLACYDLAAKTLPVASKSAFSPEQKTAIDSALKALRKLQTATRVGISMVEYGKQVIEMAQIVDEATNELPSSDITTLIKQARDLHIQANSAWSSMFDSRYLPVFVNYGGGYAIINKFGIKQSDIGNDLNNKEVVLSPIWAWANRRTQVASELSKADAANDATAMAFVEVLDKFARASNLGESTDELRKEIPDWRGQLIKFVEEK